MRTSVSVLSAVEREQVHERAVRLLATTGMRVDTAQGRGILREAGALVDEEARRVRFPAELVARSLAQAPREFDLGGRRPEWRHPLGAAATTLVADGGGTLVADASGAHRPATADDWRRATSLCDALEDVGVYWWMVEPPWDLGSAAGLVAYARELFTLFGRHVQDSFAAPDEAVWWLRALEILFGDREEVRRRRPFSFLLTPASPLIVEERYTDTWLRLRGWGIPVAIMPMPLMAATAPASRLGGLVQAHAEVLGALCLVQTADPGTPVIYAPIVAVLDPRSGRYAAGDIRNAVLSVAVTEMGRFCGLPVEASGCGTEEETPSRLAAAEKAASALLGGLPGPDLLVGPGMLAGATVSSLEQLVMDVELFGIAALAAEGVPAGDDRWLDDVVARLGPGASFLAEPSSRSLLHAGEAGRGPVSSLWQGAGAGTLDGASEEVERLLAEHPAEPLADDVEAALRELERDALRLGG